MRVSRLPYCLAGRFVTSVLGGTMILGAAGCTNLQLSLGGGGSTTSIIGFLVNTDTVSELLASLRLADGNAVFVYGTHKPDGNIGDVQAAILRDKDGNEAAVNFDGGLLSKARSFDGSSLTVTYDERSSTRLRGRVDIFFAGADAANQNQTMPFDIDLQQAIQQLVDQIKTLTGIDIATSPPPDNPGDRIIIPDSAKAAAKSGDNALSFLFYPFFVYGVAAAGYLMFQVMGRFVDAMVRTMVGVTQVVIVSAFAPFILMGEIMRGAVGLPILGVNILVELAKQGVSVPRQPFL